MRALFFAYYFPPLGGMGSLRALGWARHLPAAGVDVTVVAPRSGTYAHDSSLVPPGDLPVVRTGSLEPAVLAGRAARTGDGGVPGTPPSQRQGGWLRSLLYVPDSNSGWIPSAVVAGLREARRRRPDVILSSSPPLTAHVAARIVATRLRIPHVADFRDFFSTQRLFSGIRQQFDARLEDRILRGAALLTSPTAGILEELEARTDAPRLLVRNGFDEADFTGPEPDTPDEFRLVHVGSSYAARKSPDALLGALKKTGTRLRLVGAPDPALTVAAERAGAVDLVEQVPFRTHAEAIEEMRSASALLLFIWASDPVVARGALAGKTLEYLRSGRPVLHLGPRDGESGRFLEETGGALLVEPDDETGIREALLRLRRGDGPAAPEPGRLAPWSRAEQVRGLADRLSELLSPQRGGR